MVGFNSYNACYKDTSLFLEQAKKIFSKVDVAEGFIEIDLPFQDV